MCWNLIQRKLAKTQIVTHYTAKPFVWRRSRCRRRCGLLKLPTIRPPYHVSLCLFQQLTCGITMSAKALAHLYKSRLFVRPS